MFRYGLFLILCATAAFGRIHHLKLVNDNRKQITLSTFGFLKKGILTVNVTAFSFRSKDDLPRNVTSFGFTLDKSENSGASSYLETTQESCIFNTPSKKDKDKSVSTVYFRMDTYGHRLMVEKGKGDVANLTLSDLTREEFLRPMSSGPSSNVSGAATTTVAPPVNSTLQLPGNATTAAPSPARQTQVPPFLLKETHGVYRTYFLVHIETEKQEGLYNLYFHNCLNYQSNRHATINLSLEIVEDNNGNFLSAGEMPLPYLFFIASVVYLVIAVIWFMVLRRSNEAVYKIHWLMFAVVVMKCLSNLFHGVNHHFIQARGYHEEAWTVLYYIVYLTKGALMFICILLIGAGWAFVKHMLSDKEKKLFLIFIPLQVLDQVAWVIVEESEEGQFSYFTWKEIFILVDLLCCGAILFPVVWSIRHLQEASKTDGKAALNLNKLKLFRQFYILVVCYIYFTRIIVYLMKITLPFRLVWLTEMFLEIAVLTFFVVTGFKFRPASDNPYLQVPLDSDDEIEMEEVLTRTGNMETLTKVNQHHRASGAGSSSGGGGSSSESQEPLIKQRESSHEYD